jgi:hypothetical protein
MLLFISGFFTAIILFVTIGRWRIKKSKTVIDKLFKDKILSKDEGVY